ncbi:OmpA family protein [Hymenobacter sp. IS2118]|uniref:OmpA family protein n=1 Tax=Hymenobacter sp. IS2118 TaxID=1505605 RepID=UPI00068D4C23|nr:OmpA family protein [Hymenobacter sp. IS2118]
MKRSFWYGLAILLHWAAPTHAQTLLTGAWQGVETDTREAGRVWPAVLRLQKSQSQGLFGVLYQEVGSTPGISVTFQMRGRQTGTEVRLEHQRKLIETGQTQSSYWCEGALTLTYDAAQEKLSGSATYRPIADCDHGTFTFYRIKLKSPGTVQAGTLATHRVTGRNVRWYADAALKQPVAAGNTHRATLNKTTTFYLTQNYYPTSESPVVPITIQVAGTAPRRPTAVSPIPARKPAPAQANAARRPPAPGVVPTPVVLPTVLFGLGTAQLLPTGVPALNRLAAELLARPLLRIRVAGHTDNVGESDKNQALSEQRAEAVKAYLVKAKIAPARISTVGYGGSQPLHPSPDARNRRVEVQQVP